MCRLHENDQTKASVARSNKVASQKKAEEPPKQVEPWVYVVRNTFLTVEDPRGEPLGKRSASEPPAARHADAPDAEDDATQVRRASEPASPEPATPRDVTRVPAVRPASPRPARSTAGEFPGHGLRASTQGEDIMSMPVVDCTGYYGYWAVCPMAPAPWALSQFSMPEARLQPSSRRQRPSSPCMAAHIDVAFHDRLVVKLQEGGPAGEEALSELQAAFVRLAFDSRGCLTAQSALDAAAEHQRLQLANSLQGHIVEAMKSPHANHVVQKVVQVLRTESVRTLVVAPLAGMACELARDQYGCRIFQSLLEKCPPGDIQWLIEELLAQVTMLCCHKYGNFVIQQILQNGTLEQRDFVVRTVAVDPLGFALDKTGSNVVEKALDVCSSQDRWALFLSLTKTPATFETLACSKFGNYVARSLLYFSGEESAAARAHLRGLLPTTGPELSSWQRSVYGRRVLREFREVDRVLDAGQEAAGSGARQRHQQQKPWRGAACGKGDRMN